MQICYVMERTEISTTEHFQLNSVLVKMVLNDMLTNNEREELLHKAKLLKLKDGRWKDLSGSILTLDFPETIE
jgi:hypothetical protein